MTETTENIPSEALERLDPYGSGHWARLDRRRWRLRQATQPLLADWPTQDPATALIAGQAQTLAHEIVRHCWQLHARQEAYEHDFRELQKDADRLSEQLAQVGVVPTPEQQLDGPRLRQALLKLQSDQRAATLAWLDARSEAEQALAETVREHAAAGRKLSLLTQQAIAVPSLAQLLGFLHEPPAETVYVPEVPELDRRSEARTR